MKAKHVAQAKARIAKKNQLNIKQVVLFTIGMAIFLIILGFAGGADYSNCALGIGGC